MEDIENWAEEYKITDSIRKVAMKFGVDKSVISRKLKKYRNEFKIEFKEERKQRLINKDLKECSTCNKCKKLNEFDRASKTTDGYKFECKDCQREKYGRIKNGIIYDIDIVKQWAVEYKKYFSFSKVSEIFDIPKSTIRRLLLKYKDIFDIKLYDEFISEINKDGKHYCFVCFEIKDILCFGFRRDTDKYKNICRICQNKHFHFRYSNDIVFREQILLRSKNRDKTRVREYNRNWAKQNPDKSSRWAKEHPDRVKQIHLNWRNKNKDKIKMNLYNWRKNNPEKYLNSKRRRRARNLGVDENYLQIDRDITFKVFENKCFRCNSVNYLCVDHHYPLSRGYALSVENASILCISCNSKKYNKMPDNFYSKEEIQKIDDLFKQAKILRAIKL